MFTPCGVPQFRAPEIDEGEGYTLKSDVWLAGLIFYMLLT
jgi:serine/threonine protein kinase